MFKTLNPRPWLFSHRPDARAALRLFCFPFAGGGPQTYSMWSQSLPASVEVCLVQFPGRGGRLSEPPLTDLSQLVREISKGLQPLFDKPFVFFGHSLGSLIAFELARETRRQFGLLPLHLFASARVAPQTNRPRPPIHGLPESEFVEEIRRLNGTPKEVFEVPELLELILPVLRADFALNETYSYSSEPPLACPITAFGGLQDDSTTPDGLAAWRDQTSSTFALRMLPGDHFFINSAKALLLRMLNAELEEVMKAATKA